MSETTTEDVLVIVVTGGLVLLFFVLPILPPLIEAGKAWWRDVLKAIRS